MYSAFVCVCPPPCVYTRSSARYFCNSALSCLMAPCLQPAPASLMASSGPAAMASVVAAISIANVNIRLINLLVCELPQQFDRDLPDAARIAVARGGNLAEVGGAGVGDRQCEV